MEGADLEEAKGVLCKSTDQLVQLMVDHEYYASDYSAKSQPHASNLLHTLHDSLMQYHRFAAERALAGGENEDVAMAQRKLQILTAATQKRLHKGMPSIYAYLLGKPTHYCSHDFRYSSLDHVFRFFVSSVEQHWLQKVGFPPVYTETAPSSQPKPGSFTAKDMDFRYRPAALERFPLYFYLAGTQRTQNSASATWDSHVATEDELSLRRRIVRDAGDEQVRADHPCYRGGLDEKLFVRSKSIQDAKGDYVPLLNVDGTPKLRADHYVRVLTHEPWLVPVIFSGYTQTPKDDAPMEQKGRFALNAMILFRPWRDPLRALREWIGEPSAQVGQCADVVWECLHEAFLNWAQRLRGLAAPHAARDATWRSPPRYDTEAWWACMITRRLDNYELVCARRKEQKERPDTVDGLPVEEPSDVDAGDKGDAFGSDEDSDAGRGGNGEDMHSDADPEDIRARAAYPPVAGTQCNRLPLGSDPASALGQPAHRLGRAAEARYGRDYADVAASSARVSAPLPAPPVPVAIEQRVMNASSGNAAQIGKHAKAFYKGLDEWTIDDDILKSPSTPAQDFWVSISPHEDPGSPETARRSPKTNP